MKIQPQPSSQAQNKNVELRLKPYPPLHLYRKVFCEGCPDYEFCKTSHEQTRDCIIAHIADELTKIRQILQQTNSHRLG